MKKAICLFLPICLLFVLIIACDQDEDGGNGPSQTFTEIHGTLNTQTLTVAQSPYLVTDDITVPSGETITIQPGVEIRFDSLYWLKVDGDLQAIGNTTNPIIFTSNSPNPTFGDWRSIIFTNPNNPSHMSYCVVEYGSRYDTTLDYQGGIVMVNSSPVIDHCIVYMAGYDGIKMSDNSNPTIKHCIIVDNDANGITGAYDCNPIIQYNDVWNNHSINFEYVPAGIGEEVQTNGNLDSCDVNYNISLDPMFLGAGEFHYHSCSPCINAGDPDFALDADNTTTDMGVYYYHIDPNNIRKAVQGVLSMEHSPYRVTCDAFVLPTTSLDINAGVEIRFEGLYGFMVYGTLRANGTNSAPIRITTNQTNPPRGYWSYLGFASSSSGNEMSYCEIDHGKGVLVDETDLTMDHVLLTEMEEYGVYAHRASPTLDQCQIYGVGIACVAFDSLASSAASITNCIMSGAAGRGISLNYYSVPTISNCVIYGNGTSGIHCGLRSDATIVNNTIYGNEYYGIYCQWNSSPVIMNNIIANSYLYGIYCQYSSVPVISYNDVWNNDLMAADSLRIDYFDCDPGMGDISADPLLIDVAASDFHLSPGPPESPCIDAGNPDPAYNDEIDGTRNDMGAYGGPLGNW